MDSFPILLGMLIANLGILCIIMHRLSKLMNPNITLKSYSEMMAFNQVGVLVAILFNTIATAIIAVEVFLK